jgi:DNA primase
VLDFVSRMERVDLPAAAELIQQWFEVAALAASGPPHEPCVRDVHAAAVADAPKFNPPLRFELNELDGTHPYLGLRGFLQETIAAFGIGYCAKGIMAGRIAIPIHNPAGELVAYAGRWPGKPPDDQPKYLFPRGLRKSLELFNYHRAVALKQEKSLAVVEGFFDCMKVWQAGFERVVAIMGSSLSDAQEALIVKAVGSDGQVLLMFDEDGAGRIGREKAAARLARHVEVRIIELEVEGVQPDYLPAGEILAFLADANGVLSA